MAGTELSELKIKLNLLGWKMLTKDSKNYVYHQRKEPGYSWVMYFSEIIDGYGGWVWNGRNTSDKTYRELIDYLDEYPNGQKF